MTDTHVGIGTVKRNISELVNRVAYGGERIVLTSRGKPKAAIVSLEDYQRLEEGSAAAREAQWQAWLAANRDLAQDILARRGGEPLDVDALWKAAREDLMAQCRGIVLCAVKRNLSSYQGRAEPPAVQVARMRGKAPKQQQPA